MWENLGWFFTNKLQSDPLSDVGKPGLVLYQQNFSLTLYQMWENLGWFFTNKTSVWPFIRKFKHSLVIYQKIKKFTKVGLLPTNQNYCGTVWLFTRKSKIKFHTSWSVTNKSQLWPVTSNTKELTYLFAAVPGSSPGFNLCKLCHALSWLPDVRF